tara:strand:+ start:1201 stop:1434 length:234 start_codon:yes stop_codon:yes gene_type:complete
MELDIKQFNTETTEGMKSAIMFETNNPEYKLINSRIDPTWYFEKLIKKEIVSNCCSANIVLTDICSRCLEHCTKIEI